MSKVRSRYCLEKDTGSTNIIHTFFKFDGFSVVRIILKIEETPQVIFCNLVLVDLYSCNVLFLHSSKMSVLIQTLNCLLFKMSDKVQKILGNSEIEGNQKRV